MSPHKTPLEIFTLTKREQRVVIVIIMALLALTIAKHYRNAQSEISSPAPTVISALPTPSSEEDQAKLDEAP